MHYQICLRLALLAVFSEATHAAPSRSKLLHNRQTSSVTWYSKGCYVDDVANRLLGADHLFDLTGMTPQECQAFCASKLYHAAGTEYGQECWCGELSDGQRAAPASECNIPCTGNIGVSCGGSSRLNLYVASYSDPPKTNPGANGWISQGCWSDSLTARALPYYIPQPSQGMSVNYCTESCTAKGYAYAGLEYAAECYCGDNINGTIAEPTTDCDMPCSGNNKEFCGGPLRMNLYSYIQPSNASKTT